MKTIPVEVTEQGRPLVNTDKGAHVIAESADVLLIVVDMASERCEVGATATGSGCAPEIFITCNEDSLHLGTEGDNCTALRFPTLVGWDIFCAECSRYTLSICFHKIPNV